MGSTKLSQEEGRQLLANQRLQRPISPHLGIYKLEQTYFGSSAWNRFTGSALSGTMYAFMVGYLVAPLAGFHMESAGVAAAFGGLPLIVKGGVKFALGFPFVFHSISGTKHLLYDLGKGFAKTTIKKVDFYIWTASVLGALGLVAFV
ncbi:hypothetical protein FZEAL_1305 [Fusarium zealandicum]|uniref:Succinate dehydrogenase cytochrome b subunit n=1 Tax=Fusarium zealandicum TaxID=1053134 RepID=A0A8H4UT01_9HYPO|nr:hypothetical protein FZEAL_1305 [Fusarium zealandicum]